MRSYFHSPQLNTITTTRTNAHAAMVRATLSPLALTAFVNVAMQ